MNKLITTILTIFFSTPAYTQWSLNDVSYLIPLTRIQMVSELLPLNEILPMSLINQFPRLDPRHTQDEVLKKTAIVSLRLEPQKNDFALYGNLYFCIAQVHLHSMLHFIRIMSSLLKVITNS